MQVKKFEAPTIQEALEVIKRELGPEAIILQTKQNKRGFGLMNKASVEVTAAVSERALSKKQNLEQRLPEQTREQVKAMSAARQAEILEKAAQARATARNAAGATSRPTPAAAARAARYGSYADISDDEPSQQELQQQQQQRQQRALEQRQATSQAATQARPRRYVDIPEDNGAMIRAAQALADAQHDRAEARREQQQSRESVEQELAELKRMLEEMKKAQPAAAVAQAPGVAALESPALNEAFEQLVIQGVERRYALALAKRAGFDSGDPIDHLAGEIMGSVKVKSALDGIGRRAEGDRSGPQVLALVGPTGVGKTTTVAKIASEALLRRGCKVGLINLDNYKVAAFDQLATYAKILNVPFRSVANAMELNAALKDFQSLDLVLIDTTGRSQKDPAALGELQSILEKGAGEKLRTELVLSVTTRDQELYDMANRFMLFKPEGMILSKLDEGSVFGAILNLSQRTDLPMTYFTTGQRVPEDIEEATPERVAALILEI